MEVDNDVYTAIFQKLNEEDQETIKKICKTSNIDINEFILYLESENFNNPDFTDKDKIKRAQTELNKQILSKRAIIKPIPKREKESNFLALTQKLVDFQTTRSKSKVEGYSNQKSGEVLKSFNTSFIMPEDRCLSAEIVYSQGVELYNHWNLSRQARTEALETHFDLIVKSMKEELNIEHFSDLGVQRNDVANIAIVGRLANTDSEIEFQNNVELHNYSDDNSGYKRIKLNFENVKDPYTIFEGQIVIVRGSSDKEVFDVGSFGSSGARLVKIFFSLNISFLDLNIQYLNL